MTTEINNNCERSAVARCAFNTSLSLAKRKSLSVKEKLAIIYALNDGTKNSSVCEQFGSSQSTVSIIWKNQSAVLDAHENGITSAKSLAKRKSLSVKEKLAIIYALNDGTKNSSVCEQFGSSQSTVSIIWKNQSAVLDAHENGITSAKSGPILKIKAEQFAAMLGYTDFTCTTGWLDQFEARHNICMYEDIDAAAITSDVPTMDDIHCDKQENGDDSDTDTATVESISLKTYPELNDCVDHLERFIEATESADEGIVKAFSVVIQFVKDHRPKRVKQPWNIFSPE
ncbi:Tigger transposable element-derived protein 4, partial [Trichinella nelsoni]